MFCASVSHATSPRNIHATTREVTSTAWLKLPRDKCLGFDASKTCPIDLRILRRVLKSDSSSLSVNNVPWGRRKGAARLRLWTKRRDFSTKGCLWKTCQLLYTRTRVPERLSGHFKSFRTHWPSEQVRLRTSNRRLKKKPAKSRNEEKNGSS